MIGIFIFVVVAVVVVLVVGYIIYRLLPTSNPNDFNKVVSEYAAQNGYEFEEDITNEAKKALAGTRAWGLGGQKAQYALVKRTEGMVVKHFFWSTKVGGGSAYANAEMRYFVTIADLNLMNAAIRLEVEYPGDKVVADAFGQDLNFENKLFSDRYLIAANPKKFAYDFFTPRVIETFLDDDIYNMMVRGGKVAVFERTNFEEWKDVPPLLFAWAEKRTPFFEKLNRYLPKYIRKKKAEDEDTDESSPESLEVVCPECASDFSAIPVGGEITCPGCGAKGTV